MLFSLVVSVSASLATGHGLETNMVAGGSLFDIVIMLILVNQSVWVVGIGSELVAVRERQNQHVNEASVVKLVKTTKIKMLLDLPNSGIESKSDGLVQELDQPLDVLVRQRSLQELDQDAGQIHVHNGDQVE